MSCLTLMSFDLMPALNEGDEHISLSDILSVRGGGLMDMELYAVCQECCLAIQSVHNSSEMFQTLCISPDSLAFDCGGSVCFLDLPSDPDPLYVPPEYEKVGNSFKAHLYSLGMTMLYAAEYRASPGTRRRLATELSDMIARMTTDDYDERANLEEVLDKCRENLSVPSSEEVCQNLAMVGRLETSQEEDRLYTFSDQTLVSQGQTDHSASEASSPTSLEVPDSPQDSSVFTEGPGTVGNLASPPNVARIACLSGSYLDAEWSIERPRLLDELAEESDLANDHRLIKVLQFEEEDSWFNFEDSLKDTPDGRKVDTSANLTTSGTEDSQLVDLTVITPLANVSAIARSPLPLEAPGKVLENSTEAETLNETAEVASPDVNWQVIGTESGESQAAIGSEPKSAVGVSGPSPGGNSLLRWRMGSHRLQGTTTLRTAGASSPFHAFNARNTPSPALSLQQRDSSPHKATVTFNTLFGKRDTNGVSGILDEAASLQGDGGGGRAWDTITTTTLGHLLPGKSMQDKNAGFYSPVSTGMMGSREDDEEFLSVDRRRELVTSPSNDTPTEEATMLLQGQCVQEILEKLGCGLHENELWALCRECVLALTNFTSDFPAYISLETVLIEDNGHISYRPVPEDRKLEIVYLAPELQQHGVITQKTCLFGIAAMLWSAADYRMPINQEPALSEELECMLISMTQDESASRPAVKDVLRMCDDYERRQDINSTHICKALAVDARKAEKFGKSNPLVKALLHEQTQKHAESQHAQLLDSIRNRHMLKPVSERRLAEKPVVQTLHEKLMHEIRKPARKLRKSSKPKVMPVAEMFLQNPILMERLLHATGKVQHLEEETDGKTYISPLVYQEKTPSKFSTTPRSVYSPQSNPSQTPLISELDSTCSSAPQVQSPKVPSAYTSSATHFSPIIVSSGENSNVKKDQDKSFKTTLEVDLEKDRMVARKMKELKKNLMKNRLPLTLAKDLENDITQEPAHSHHAVNNLVLACSPPNTAAAHQVNSPIHMESVSTVNSASTVIPAQHIYSPTSSVSSLNVCSPTSSIPVANVNSIPSNVSSPYMHSPVCGVHAPYVNSPTSSVPPPHVYSPPNTALPHSGMSQTISPHQTQTQMPMNNVQPSQHIQNFPGMNVQQGLMHQAQGQYSSPQFGVPMQQNGGMIPFPMHFQQDPRTGLFQLVLPGMQMPPATTPISPSLVQTSPAMYGGRLGQVSQDPGEISSDTTQEKTEHKSSRYIKNQSKKKKVPTATLR